MRSPGLKPGGGHCVVFLGKTLDPEIAFSCRCINVLSLQGVRGLEIHVVR